jgi:hypothetical protein
MSFPLDILVASHGGNDGQVLILSIENGVVFRVPADGINRLASIKELRSHHTIFTPYFDLTILSSSGKCSTFI